LVAGLAHARPTSETLLQALNAVVRRSGSTLCLGGRRPDDIVSAMPGVRLLAATSVFDADTFNQVRGSYRLMGKVMSPVAALRDMAQFHRYASCAGRDLYDAHRDPRVPSIHPRRRR
jgi:hypothetical protein